MGRCRPLLARRGVFIFISWVLQNSLSTLPQAPTRLLLDFRNVARNHTLGSLVSDQATSTAVTLWLLDLLSDVAVTQLPHKGPRQHLRIWSTISEIVFRTQLGTRGFVLQGLRDCCSTQRQRWSPPQVQNLSNHVIMAEAFRTPDRQRVWGVPKGTDAPSRTVGVTTNALTPIPIGSSRPQKKVPPVLEYRLPSSSHWTEAYYL